jgi:hypothetical protein
MMNLIIDDFSICIVIPSVIMLSVIIVQGLSCLLSLILSAIIAQGGHLNVKLNVVLLSIIIAQDGFVYCYAKGHYAGCAQNGLSIVVANVNMLSAIIAQDGLVYCYGKACQAKDKHSSLLRKSVNYARKIFYSTGPASSKYLAHFLKKRFN